MSDLYLTLYTDSHWNPSKHHWTNRASVLNQSIKIRKRPFSAKSPDMYRTKFIAFDITLPALIWSWVIRFNDVCVFFSSKIFNVKFKHQVQLLDDDYSTGIAINSTSSICLCTHEIRSVFKNNTEKKNTSEKHTRTQLKHWISFGMSDEHLRLPLLTWRSSWANFCMQCTRAIRTFNLHIISIERSTHVHLTC